MPTGKSETTRKKVPKKKATTTSISKKIKTARLAKRISLDQIANETGFALSYLKDIEAGRVTPPVGALLQISKALQIDSGSLLREQSPAFKERIKAYTKRTENYAYETLTPGAENKHLSAFHVTVETGQEHSGVGYQHEGEEFNYVLKGKVQVIVGDYVNTLGAGDSLHFNSGIRHQLKNVGKETAELIVVIYSP
ncbi:MAG: helix-turn-helix transcriptional regulator [Deltaproteobacteria bacterium]|nr:helix-turn-helix transcriptional regulator [Deltaproteobacteria bacterium]